MTAKTDKPAADRRSFLKLAGATAVTGSATLGAGAVAVAATPVEPKAGDLYRETEHVRRYYELARG